MAVTSGDIYFYGAANMVEDDTSSAGGAIDRSIKVAFGSALDANDTLDVYSSNTGDITQTLTITGRLANGSITTENYSLAGTGVQNGATTFERILKIVSDAAHSGTITIEENSGGTTVATMEGASDNPGGTSIDTLRRMFYKATANASGGADKLLYEKFFIANTHASLALNDAAIQLTSDGTSGNIMDFRLEDAVNDNESVAARLDTTPTGLLAGSWDDTQKTVPGSTLGDRTTGTSDHIGVWLRMDLDAGTSPEKATIQFTVTGNST